MVLFRKARSSIDMPWRNLAKLDLIWGVIAPVLALWIRGVNHYDHDFLQDTLIYVAVASILTAACFIFFKLSHRVSRFFSADDVLTVSLASALAVISTVLVCFLLTRLDHIARSVPILHFFALSSGNIAARMFRYMRRRRRDRPRERTCGRENVIVVGVTDLAWHYMQIVDSLISDSYSIVALVDEKRNLQGRYVDGYPIAGHISDIESVLEEYEVHGVPIHRLALAVEPKTLSPELRDLLFHATSKRGIEVDVLPERLGLERKRRPAAAATSQAPMCNEKCPPDSFFWRSKRAADIVLSATMLLITLPVAAAICFLLLFDYGVPILFWQVRTGRNEQKIRVYKFRTLRAPYDRSGKRLPEKDRVLWLGKILRRSHLDELPQLVAVLRGDMSLIGPRPLLPIDLPDKIGLRLAVRPGITGWAQVNGATLITPEEKNAMDEWYVRHASWPLEFRIAAATVRALFAPMRRNEKAIAEGLCEQQQTRQGTVPTYERPIRFFSMAPAGEKQLESIDAKRRSAAEITTG